MPVVRRSFVRELLALIPALDAEFSGQVRLLPFEEANANEMLVEITPSKGYYAHASFVFRICEPPNYPFQIPTISCLSRVFHPNIHAYMLNDNVCLNFLNNWSARYGLKDILHAILFLFYEPNFDDPWNPNASHPENGLTIEQTIQKSFRGGIVNSILYEPNRAWLHWAEENDPPSTKECSDARKSPSMLSTSPIQHESTTINYFREALSGQYSPMAVISQLGLDYNSGGVFLAEYAYIRHITVNPINFVVDSVDAVNSFRRYYYLEQCINDQQEIFDDLDTRSMTMPTAGHRQLQFAGNQSSVLGNWFLRTKGASSDGNEPFYEQPNDEQPEFKVDTEEYVGDLPSCSCDEDTVSMMEQAEEEERRAMETGRIETVNGVVNVLQTDADSAVRKPEVSENAASVECVIHGDGLSVNAVQVDIGETSEGTVLPVNSLNVTTEPITDAGETCVIEQDEWQGTMDIEVDRQGSSANEDTEEVNYATDLGYCRLMYQHQEELARRLSPWWWIIYQSRWPAYLAPRHMTQMRRCRRRNDFVRVSSIALRSDLFRLGVGRGKPTVYLLLDSLSLSPFSPILNRAVVLPDREKKIVTWYGLDWYSVSDAFRSLHTDGSLTPRNHFYIPILPFTVFYLHNWLAYVSRVELYGSSLGYSRPLNAGTLSSMGSTCLTPASLGCGQCCYADGWPFWLAWRLSRVLCRMLVFCCVRPIPACDERDRGSPVEIGVAFPFSDLDEI